MSNKKEKVGIRGWWYRRFGASRRAPWQDNRVLMVVSLVLGVLVWLVFAVINGDTWDYTVRDVPVHIELQGTMAEELGLSYFFPNATEQELKVSVVVSARRYDAITADDLNAQLVLENVNAAKDYLLNVRVTPANPQDTRFTIKDWGIGGMEGLRDVSVVFDYKRTIPYPLTPSVSGSLKVPDELYAGELMLSKKFVSITGPQQKLAAISQVLAEIKVDGPLESTQEYKNVEIIPVNADGNAIPQYLTIESGINATLPVWKRTVLRPVVDFSNTPDTYLGKPLRYTIAPGAVRAALASESILADQSYSVGTIDFAALSPGHTTIAFPADEMKHIAVLDGTKAFTVRVDLSGMATRTMSLAGSHIRLAAAPNAPVYQAWFRDVPNITIVGPEEMLADLTPQNLWGEALVTEAILPGPNTLELRVRVTRDGASTDEDLPESHPDCWAYGTYTVRAALTEE